MVLVPRLKGEHGIWMFVYPLIALCVAAPFFRDAVTIMKWYRTSSAIAAAGIAIFLLGAVGMEVLSYQFLRGPSGDASMYKSEVL